MKTYSFKSSQEINKAFRNSERVLSGLWPRTIAASLGVSLAALSAWEINRATDAETNPPEVSLIESQSAPSPIAVISTKRALALFEELADNRSIPFKANDGCFARAEKMRRLAEEHGLHVMKVWAFADQNRLLGFRGPVPDDNLSVWNYHVAIALPVVNTRGKVEIYVFDPTIFDGPAEIPEWAQKLNANLLLIRLTAPDKMPLKFYNLPGAPTTPYTRDGYTWVIANKFGSYYNTETIRHVYHTKLREKLCSDEHDVRACKKSGYTWASDVPSRAINKKRSFAQILNIHF